MTRTKRFSHLWVALTFAVILLPRLQTTCLADEADTVLSPVEANRLFTLRVLPLLKKKCFPCHGDDASDLRGDYQLLTRDGMLAGGESGEPSLVPGKPEARPL